MKSTAISLMALAAALGAFAAAPAVAQPGVAQSSATRTAQAYHAPKNAFGQPDLEGVWTNATLTRLERDPKYGANLVMPSTDAQAVEKENSKFIAEANKPTDPKVKTTDLPYDCGRGFKGSDCGYNFAWTDPGTEVMAVAGQKRTSIIVEPANGQLPPLTPEGKKRLAARFQRSAFDGPEARSLGERCILSFGSAAGPPMLPLLYNNNYQIFQTRDAVTIVVEMVHDTRIIRLNTGHLPAKMKQWMGDSVGHWEGDTLVVETTNMRPEQGFRGAGGDTKVVERFTRIGPRQILYRFTVDDPEVYTAPFTGEVALNASKGPIYEYACHEGNYAMPGILAGARELEKQGRDPGAGPRDASGAPAAEGQ
ncbi:hypothetical protein [Phenylobacterium sp.]|uniref:hypothetical protein n=1 Tax=Phenylobacterium sp. TaxID=1871053 RepID=UPI002DF2AAE3|nr:hypothetical protein [Phenylobacterium sp.]